MDYREVHGKRFERTLEVVPKGPGKALDIGYETPITQGLREKGWEVFRIDLPEVNIETQKWPFEDGFFDLVMMCEVIEHMSLDPMFPLWEANRTIKEGGRLILTTPNICSSRAFFLMCQGRMPYLHPKFTRTTNRHNIEYDVHTISAMASCAGFEGNVWTENVWEHCTPNWHSKGMEYLKNSGAHGENRGDCILGSFRRTQPRERFPAFLYD